MSLDAYSMCPGGTGKRIKFCCKDLLPDLQEIHRMYRGDQNAACLKRIEQAERKAPDRACLLALKCMILAEMERSDERWATVKRFVEKHPDNPIALAEQAALIAAADDGDVHAAMSFLQRAIELSGKIVPQVYDAMGAVAHRFLLNKQFIPAMALRKMQNLLRDDDPQPIEAMELNIESAIPLLMKEPPKFLPCPADGPWKTEFGAINQAVSSMQWQRAANLLTALIAQAPDMPMLWRNLAAVQGWLGNTEGCIEAYRKYATMYIRGIDIPSLEDASEAEALAMFLSGDPLGDREELQVLTCEIGDVEAVQAAIAAAPRVVSVPPETLDDIPTSKAVFLLLDRLPLTAENIATTTAEQVPCPVASMFLYEQETGNGGEPDRAARIEIVATAGRLAEEVQAWLNDLVPETRGVVPTMKLVSRLSASSQLLRCHWYLPSDLPSEPVFHLHDQFISHAILHQWTAMPLGVFGGKSPREAAADPAQHVKLMAAILVLEHWTE